MRFSGWDSNTVKGDGGSIIQFKWQVPMAVYQHEGDCEEPHPRNTKSLLA